MRRLVVLGTLATSSLVACGDDAAQVRLVPHFGACGKPAGNTLLVTPMGELLVERIALDGTRAVALADLPLATEQLAVEVVGANGAIVAAGKTARFELAALADGAELPIAMAPPDGFCELGAMIAARDRPLIARSGDGALIAGGYGVGGAPLASAEYFDPATDTFTEVALPAGFLGVRGLAGAALVALSGDRVALVGGPSSGFAVYHPASGFAADLVNQVRAHAAVVALDDDHVLLAGGCSQLDDAGQCGSAARDDSMILDLRDSRIEFGPGLSGPRLGGQAFVERGLDGARRVIVVGGVDGVGDPNPIAERLELGTGAITVLAGHGGAATALDPGTILTGFGPPGEEPSGTTAAIVPGVGVTRPRATTMARAGVVMLTQEDGQALVLGGGPPLRYQPAAGTWRVLPVDGAAPALPGGHNAIVLGDGSVLVVGGRDGAGPDRRAWRFRPPLLGPLTGALTVVPSDDASAPPFAPLDPALVETTAGWRLRGAPAGGDSLAIVGGPIASALRLELTGAVPAEGVAVLVGFVDAGTHHRAILIPGAPASLEQRVAGVATTVCRGTEEVPAAIPIITLEVRVRTLRVVAGGRVVLTCEDTGLARGRIGVAAIGGGVVGIETIAVNR